MSRLLIMLGVVIALAITSSASTSTVTSAPAAYSDVKVTHAVTAPLVFALLMPVGAIISRTFHHRSVVMLHASLMIFAWVLSIVALGTGIYIAFYINMLDHPHAIIGFIVILGFALQPVTGWWHHVLYKKRSQDGSEDGKEATKIKRSYKVKRMHVWWGRILITLGIINGSLGFQLSRQVYAIHTPLEVEVGYGVGAGVIWAVWMSVLIVVYMKNQRVIEAGKSEKALDK